MKQLLDNRSKRRALPFARRGVLIMVAALIAALLLTAVLWMYYSPAETAFLKQEQPGNPQVKNKTVNQPPFSPAGKGGSQLQTGKDSTSDALQHAQNLQAKNTAGATIAKGQ